MLQQMGGRCCSVGGWKEVGHFDVSDSNDRDSCRVTVPGGVPLAHLQTGTGFPLVGCCSLSQGGALRPASTPQGPSGGRRVLQVACSSMLGMSVPWAHTSPGASLHAS